MRLFATYPLKLNVLVYLFMAYQRFRAISESYWLQIELKHPCATYVLMLHNQVRLLRLIKNMELSF